MKYDNFENFLSSLDESNNEIISRLEDLRARFRKEFFKENIIVLIYDVIILLIIKTISFYTLFALAGLDFFIFLLNSVIKWGHTETKKLNSDYKEKVVSKLLENFIEELDYVPLKGMPKSIYNESEYDNHYDLYRSEDYFEGKINNQKIIMSDLIVEEEVEEKNKDGEEETHIRTVFKGFFGKIDLNKAINSDLIIRNSYGLSFTKNKKVEMDSYDFEERFNVYSDNNIVAMQLLTADIQEDILELYNKYKIRFYLHIKNDKLYVLFETDNMFELFYDKKNPNIALEKYFAVMTFVYKLVSKIQDTVNSTPV